MHENSSCPQQGDMVLMHYSAGLVGHDPFFTTSKPFSFQVGQHKVISGLESSVCTMQRGERGKFTLTPEQAYGDSGCPPVIPAKSSIVLEIELVDFFPSPQAELSQEQRLALAEQKQNDAMDKKSSAQLQLFEDALALLQDVKDSAPTVSKIKLAAAQAYYNVEDCYKAVWLCEQILKTDPQNAGARLMRAKSHIQLGGNKLAEAKHDLNWVKDHSTEFADQVQIQFNKLQAVITARDRPGASNTFTSSFSSLNNSTQILHPLPVDAHKDTKRVYFDLTHVAMGQQRVEFELFCDTHPKTSENFLQLCLQDIGGYHGTKFHRIVKGFALQGGRLENDFPSIYGPRFADENLVGCSRFTEPFLLAMANQGGQANTNSTQFFITTCPHALPHLDGRYVVFGRVVLGQDVLLQVENVAVVNDEPTEPVVIADCGQVVL